MSDQKLFVEKLKLNDPQAFNTLVDQNNERIYNICYGFLRNKEDAEDASQEVFIEIHKNISTFREESSLTTWMHRIAVNRSLNVLRRNKVRNFFDSIEQTLLLNKKEPNSNSDPYIELNKKELAKQIQNAINKLPKNQNIAFTLHNYNNLSYAQIAEIMNNSLSSVESLIHRAKTNLKKSLKEINTHKP